MRRALLVYLDSFQAPWISNNRFVCRLIALLMPPVEPCPIHGGPRHQMYSVRLDAWGCMLCTILARKREAKQQEYAMDLADAMYDYAVEKGEIH